MSEGGKFIHRGVTFNSMKLLISLAAQRLAHVAGKLRQYVHGLRGRTKANLSVGQ